MSNKRWIIKEKFPDSFSKNFPEYSDLVLQLLYDRGITIQKQIDEFFNPDYETDLHDPFLLKDIGKAVKRIKKAVKEKEKVVVYGDYDCDGVSATAVMVTILQKIGLHPEIYIPDRSAEGYGLNFSAIEEIASLRVKLIITVDCGVTDFEEVRFAKEKGLDVIIIDHHTVLDKLPQAVAVIHPGQKEDQYPFKELAATGVAFKVAQAINRKLSDKDISFEKWLLDLVALATITDMMKLLGENRTLVKYGLYVLSKTKRKGLQALMRISGIIPQHSKEVLASNIDSFTLGFILGPRINAAGRLGKANTSYKLLMTEDENEAQKLAEFLDQRNKERQQMIDKILKAVEERLKIAREIPKLIFEGSKDWPIGVAGLVASRLMEKYSRPVIIYEEKKDRIVASCRSIVSFHITQALSRFSDLLIEYGGHRQAAGFKIKKENFKDFKKGLIELTDQSLKHEDLVSLIEIDKELEMREINFDVLDAIEMFSPFGVGNKKPIFLLRDAKVVEAKRVGSAQSHLKIRVEKDGKAFPAIFFNHKNHIDLQMGDNIDLVFELISDEFNGFRNLTLKIIDFKICKSL